MSLCKYFWIWVSLYNPVFETKITHLVITSFLLVVDDDSDVGSFPSSCAVICTTHLISPLLQLLSDENIYNMLQKKNMLWKSRKKEKINQWTGQWLILLWTPCRDRTILFFFFPKIETMRVDMKVSSDLYKLRMNPRLKDLIRKSCCDRQT